MENLKQEKILLAHGGGGLLSGQYQQHCHCRL